MALMVDDVAEAILGPWGLALGAGIGLALVARKKLGPAVGIAAAGESAVGKRARRVVAGLAPSDRARSLAAGLREWWQTLYSEAYAEWEAGRGATATIAAAAPASSAAVALRSSRTRGSTAKAASARGGRQRGADGRFVRRSVE